MAAQIRCGTRASQLNDLWVGKTVAEVRRDLQRQLDVPEGAPAVVTRDGGASNTPVNESYRIVHGDLVEFIRPQGTKG